MSETTETIEQIAKRLHAIYIPNDKTCTFTDKDWIVAGEIAALQGENKRYKNSSRASLEGGK